MVILSFRPDSVRRVHSPCPAVIASTSPDLELGSPRIIGCGPSCPSKSPCGAHSQDASQVPTCFTEDRLQVIDDHSSKCKASVV